MPPSAIDQSEKPFEKQACDLIVEAPWVLPVAPQNVALADHGVAVRDGRILAVAPQADLAEQFEPAEHVHVDEGILTPGLINAHGHAAMTLMRGAGEDLPLQAWLSERIWPLEAKLVNAEYVRVGTTLGMAEMLLSGTTTFTDMYFYPEVVAEAVRQAGMRAQLAFPIFDGVNAWASGLDDCFSKGLALHDAYRNDDRVMVAFGPHAPYTVPQKALEKILMLSQEIYLSVHIHLHENAAEVAEARAAHSQSWVEKLADIGLINPQLQAVHMTQLEPNEIELVAAGGAHVVHCPNSNLKLASGICPTTALGEAGVNVAIGTDGAASNNTLDMAAEARTASLLAKHHSERADAGGVDTTLAMATLHGARALGREDDLGSLEPGKLADIACFQPDGFAALPLYDPMASFVHGAPHHKATHVWVAGDAVVRDGRLTGIDEHALKRDVEQQAERVRALL